MLGSWGGVTQFSHCDTLNPKLASNLILGSNHHPNQASKYIIQYGTVSRPPQAGTVEQKPTASIAIESLLGATEGEA